MKSPILNFFLLVFRISLDFCPDAGHKDDRFSKALPKKSFKFVPSKRNNTIAFNLDLVLLPAKVDFILEEQSRKKDALKA